MKKDESKYRFEFGKNWQDYLKKLSSNEIKKAKESFERFDVGKKNDKSFLDIGSGSGLFSLAAFRLGFKNIVSFDFDIDSVNTTKKLHDLNGSNLKWKIFQGSILDQSFLDKLGKFDVVYSWGVLHHTGEMWKAIENAGNCVDKNGFLIISIYNKQFIFSNIWKYIKLFYNISPKPIKFCLEAFFYFYFFCQGFLADLVRFKSPIKRHFNERRGMNFFNDVKDWIGGYPFEYAGPKEIENFVNNLGFVLLRKYTVGYKLGCNEFFFKRRDL